VGDRMVTLTAVFFLKVRSALGDPMLRAFSLPVFSL
jgi:hypothetical protein